MVTVSFEFIMPSITDRSKVVDWYMVVRLFGPTGKSIHST
eukprot:COSAG02_NODE_36875_length_449_cov_1.000000_1_plen_39_part_10